VFWCKPKSSKYKLNIDDCYFPNGSGATGAIIRNDKGVAVAGLGCVLSNIADATSAEA
jgi:hypothetical protein